jgi:hypothetical protein
MNLMRRVRGEEEKDADGSYRNNFGFILFNQA